MEVLERDAHEATLHSETLRVTMRKASPVRTAARPVLVSAPPLVDRCADTAYPPAGRGSS